MSKSDEGISETGDFAAQRQRTAASFEDAWGRGNTPSIDDFLDGEGTQRRALLEKLVHVDLECRIRSGDPVRVEQYLKRYPELGERDDTVLALIWIEYEARRCHDTAVGDAEYAGRFPQFRERLPWKVAQQPGADDRKWKVGDVILGVYEVKRLHAQQEYAEGGMGVVYRVRHRGWDLDLAVKSPKPEMVQKEEVKRNFELECEAWIKLGLHPNVVSCYYVRRVDAIPRVFAEFVEGGSLADWIDDKRLYQGGQRDACRHILDAAIQMAWGLDFAHERGLIHQDVKPGNVMMQGTTAKVTDFGLSRVEFPMTKVPTDSTQASVVASWGGMTPAFCSPEQLEAAVQAEAGIHRDQRTKLTRRTDIWSWAVSVLAMFCGRSPCRHGGHTAGEVFDAYLRGGPEDAALPPMPRGLVRLMRQCLQREPNARPRTMKEVAAELIEVYKEAIGAEYPRREPVSTKLQAESLNNRAVSLLDLGLQGEATALLEEAWQRHPWQPQVTYNRGLLAWRAGRITDGDLLVQLEELGKTRAQDWEAAYSLGLVRLERGDVAQAVKTLQHAAELGGDCEVQATLEHARSLLPRAPRCVRSFTGRSPYLTRVWLSQDARRVLSQVDEKTLRVWDPSVGATIQRFDAQAGDGAGFLSADLRWELSPTPEGALQLWKVATRRCVQTFQEIRWGAATGVTSADGRWKLSAGEQNALELRNAADGRLVRSLRGHAAPVHSLAMSADGRWALSGSDDKTIRLWQVETGCCLRTFQGHADPVTAVYLSADSRWALTASEGKTLFLWNLELLSSDERRFVAPMLLCHVSTSEEAGRAQAEFVELCASAREALVNHQYAEALEMVRAARALPGYEVARELLELWARTGRRCRRRAPQRSWCMQTIDGHAGDVCSVCLAADGRLAVSGGQDKAVRIWQVDTGRCQQTWEGHTDWVRSVTLLGDGQRVLSASWDKTLRLWDPAAAQPLRVYQGHDKYVEALAASADGRRAVSGSWDNSLRLWDLETGRCLRTLQGHQKHVTAVAMSADARWALSGSEDRTMRLWDLASGRVERVFEGHTDWVQAVAQSADGRWALSAAKDWTIRLWDVATGNYLHVFQGHTSAVHAVAFSADDRFALSGSNDKTVRVWELASGRCLQTLEGHTGAVTAVSWSADGRRVLSGSEDGKLRVWLLDWDYEFPGWADWHEGARPYLDAFLRRHAPYGEDGVTRTGRPHWHKEDFLHFLRELESHGFGWLRAEGVLKELHRASERWPDPKP